MDSSHKPRVVVVGAGAAGALTALHLARDRGRRRRRWTSSWSTRADRAGRGTAFGTTDDAAPAQRAGRAG